MPFLLNDYFGFTDNPYLSGFGGCASTACKSKGNQLLELEKSAGSLSLTQSWQSNQTGLN